MSILTEFRFGRRIRILRGLEDAIDHVEEILSGRPSDAGPVEDTDEWMMLRFFCAVAAPVE